MAMKLTDFVGKVLEKTKINSSDTITIDIPAGLYYKELALYTAYSYIANAISMCEIRVFENGEPVKNDDYFKFNVSPNKNDSSNLFWHKIIKNMIRNPDGALVVNLRGNLYVAEDFNIQEERPVLGNIYDGVELEGGLQLNKVFKAKDVMRFKMEDDCVRALVDGIYADYGKLLQTASKAFQDTNGHKYKFKIDGVKAGDEEFNKEFNEVIAKNIKDYMENDYATYVEYDGEELVEETTKSATNSSDVIALRQDMFEMVGQALKIPQSLMTGNITSMTEVVNAFLTFAVEPFANTITETLNKWAGIDNWTDGNYFKCYTGKIKHHDIFDTAADADKLLAASIMSPNELREELELKTISEPWGDQFYITNNYRNSKDEGKEEKTDEIQTADNAL